MKANLIKIGNSRGIRIPKTVLDECNFGETVEIIVKNHTLILKPARKPREGWEESFKEMAKNGDDQLDDLKDFREFNNEWDEKEWEWK